MLQIRMQHLVVVKILPLLVTMGLHRRSHHTPNPTKVPKGRRKGPQVKLMLVPYPSCPMHQQTRVCSRPSPATAVPSQLPRPQAKPMLQIRMHHLLIVKILPLLVTMGLHRRSHHTPNPTKLPNGRRKGPQVKLMLVPYPSCPMHQQTRVRSRPSRAMTVPSQLPRPQAKPMLQIMVPLWVTMSLHRRFHQTPNPTKVPSGQQKNLRNSVH